MYNVNTMTTKEYNAIRDGSDENRNCVVCKYGYMCNLSLEDRRKCKADVPVDTTILGMPWEQTQHMQSRKK